MLRENFRMGASSLRRNPLRSGLSTLGVAIGIAAVVAVVSVSDGLTQSVSDEFGNVGGGTISVMYYPAQDDVLRRRMFLTLEEGEQAFRESPALDAFDPEASFDAEVRFGDEARRLNIAGVGPQHLEVFGKSLTAGRFLNWDDMPRHARAAVVGSEVFDEFGGVENAVGQRLLLDGVLFTVVGVLEDTPRGFLMFGEPNRTILIPITTARDRFETGPMLQFHYRARAIDEIEIAEDQLRSAFRRARELPDEAEDDFQILSLDSLVGAFRGVMVGVVLVGTALAAISLLAGGIGVMNVMLVSVRERSREIGIRKAIGAVHSHLVTQFLVEAVLLSLTGGLLGAALGAVLRLLAPAFAPELPVGPPPLLAFAAAFVFSTVVGVVFGIYPAVVAARRDPWESLRSE